MKRKIVLFTVVLVILLMASSLSVMGKKEVISYSQEDLYVPDMTEAYLADELAIGYANEVITLPVLTPFWADMVNVENVPEDGEGVYVAVLDTGLVPEWPFFFANANIAYELGIGFTHDVTWDPIAEDYVFSDLKVVDFITDLASGHGTHVASTVVGFNYNNQVWVNGVAPKATIIPVRVLDAWIVPGAPAGLETISGGTDPMIAAGIYYVADLAESLGGPVVINMSLGGPYPAPEIEDAIDYAIEKGVIVVASAGNSGSDGMGYPGAYPQVISAAAAGWAEMMGNYPTGWYMDVPENLKSQDSLGNTFQVYLEDFSSRPNNDLGQKHQDLDVAAPGAWIVGPYRSAFADNLGYWYVSGTSMAAPHVSAISALVLQDNADLEQAAIEKLLKVAAAGNPLPASDAIVAFVFGQYYTATWDGGDAGKGFLQADQAVP